jgi:hypothetical protein
LKISHLATLLALSEILTKKANVETKLVFSFFHFFSFSVFCHTVGNLVVLFCKFMAMVSGWKFRADIFPTSNPTGLFDFENGPTSQGDQTSLRRIAQSVAQYVF